MDKLQETGRCAYVAITEMVDALNCDYDRLTELANERQELLDDLENGSGDAAALNAWDDANLDELQALAAAAGDCEDRDAAEQRIHEDALSVEVRSGWTSIGDKLEPEEFSILLTTGGPAVRIRGELDDGEPCRAWLEVQDWGTPWTQYYGASQSVLLDYARCFYFGE